MDTNTITEPPEFIEIDNEKIATRHRSGNNPDVFWLGGYRSNMLGTKAQAVDGWTKKKNISYTRHDYSGILWIKFKKLMEKFYNSDHA